LGEPAAEFSVVGVSEPGILKSRDHLGWRWKVGDTSWQVTVRAAIREKTTDKRHYFAEVDRVAPSNYRVTWHSHIEESDTASGTNHACKFAKKLIEVGEVA
jgi:hypothetical protein